jgi:hypothetical protein
LEKDVLIITVEKVEQFKGWGEASAIDGQP